MQCHQDEAAQVQSCLSVPSGLRRWATVASVPRTLQAWLPEGRLTCHATDLAGFSDVNVPVSSPLGYRLPNAHPVPSPGQQNFRNELLGAPCPLYR